MANPRREPDGQIFRVLPRQVERTIAAALREWLPGKPWSEVRQLLKARRVTVSGNLCVDPGYRLRLADVVKVLAHSLAPRRAKRTSASAIWISIWSWWRSRQA